MVNDLKKELSKLSGVDFFNPKFRDVFKKYFPNDNNENDANTNEEERLQEVIGNEQEEDINKTEIEQEEEKLENIDETEDEESVNDEYPAEPVAEETTEGNVGDELAEEKPAEKVASVFSTEEDNQRSNSDNSEILELKLELELIKANIRKDRLEAAKQLFIHEIHSMDDLVKVPGLVERFPEWVNKDKPQVQPFGMPVDDMGDGLTEEEKRLKSLVIDPRS